MALVTYGPIVSDARKKIAGVVATKAHAGNFMRKKVSPIQPRTQAQRNVRASFTAHSKAWAGLGAAVIAGFNALAKSITKKDRLGNSVTLTGLQLFQSLSRNIDTVAGTPLVAVPATLVATTPGTLVSAPNETTTPAFLITPTNYPAVGEAAAIYAAAQMSPGKTFVGKTYRFIMKVAYNVSPTPYNVLSTYNAKFGALIQGKKLPVLVKHINITTGAAGQPAASTDIVT